MANIELSKSIDDALGNTTGKVTETAGDLLDAGLTYVGRNVLKKYKYDKADEQFQLTAYKQAQDHALKLQEIKNQKIQEYFGEFIESNIKAIASKTLQLAEYIPKEKKLSPNIGFFNYVLEEAKYTTEDELRTLFANLLASCIDIDYSRLIHPSFVEKIKQLSSFDLRVLEFISNQLMFCYSEMCVDVELSEMRHGELHQLYLFTNMQDFNGDSQQVDKSIDLLISLGILEVDRRDFFRSEEYADRLVAFINQGYVSTYESDLFSSYYELCVNNYYDEYEGTLYQHDRFFYGIELSPELENMIRDNCKNEDSIKIDAIDSIRRVIRFTSYGKHFKKAVFRRDS